MALLISAERTRSSRVPGETNRLSESSRGESGEDSEEEETTEGTSEDAGATSEDGDHVTSLSEDDTDVPSKASATGSHGLRRKKDQSIVVSVLLFVGSARGPSVTANISLRGTTRQRVQFALVWEASPTQMMFQD